MDKRSLLALGLAMAVLIIYQLVFIKPPPEQATQQAQAVNAPAPSAPAPAPAVAGAPEERPAVPEPEQVEKIVTVDTDLYTATFSSRGGTVRSWTLKDYKDNDGFDASLLREGGPFDSLAIGWAGDYSVSNQNFALTGSDLWLDSSKPTGTIVFEYFTPRYSIRRTFTFYHDRYQVDIRDEVKGTGGYQITLGGELGIHKKKATYAHVGPVLLQGTDREEFKFSKIKEARIFTEDVKWIAIEDKYFCAALVPKGKVLEAKVYRRADSAAISFKGVEGVNEFSLYVGPKKQEDLAVVGGGLEHIVDFGFFSILSRPIFWILKYCYSVVGNYGWAIVLLTIIVRVPFLPLVHKGQKSMKRLQKVQPLMQQVREKYKKDPKRMQQEMMAIYKKHKVNPMGGCLPMLVQIPVFFALYKVLMVAIELRGAPWALWITDLSAKDPYYILPIVMGISMVVQQKMTPTSGDPKQQKLMMFMPVIFTFLFLNFASGLVLYWLVNNLLAIGQQLYVNRKKDDD